VHSCMFSGHWIDGGFLRQKAPPHRHASRLNGDRGVPVRFGRHLSAPSFQQLPLVGTRLRGAPVFFGCRKLWTSQLIHIASR